MPVIARPRRDFAHRPSKIAAVFGASASKIGPKKTGKNLFDRLQFPACGFFEFPFSHAGGDPAGSQLCRVARDCLWFQTRFPARGDDTHTQAGDPVWYRSKFALVTTCASVHHATQLTSIDCCEVSGDPAALTAEVDDVDWNREADASIGSGRGDDRTIDPDHPTAGTEQWTARVAGIDRGIGLGEPLPRPSPGVPRSSSVPESGFRVAVFTRVRLSTPESASSAPPQPGERRRRTWNSA
jgi:hypothetical protein